VRVTEKITTYPPYPKEDKKKKFMLVFFATSATLFKLHGLTNGKFQNYM
jgi:hypothetical protein